MRDTPTRSVVNRISNLLGDCSQKVICRYIGVTPVALSQNIDRPFSEILNNKVGSRLDSLLYLLECSEIDKSLDVSIIHRLLTLPAYKEKDGWKIDVVSAIHQDADKKVLHEIFNHAVSILRKPVGSTPAKGSLYAEIHATGT
jgi:hypothetical protein